MKRLLIVIAMVGTLLPVGAIFQPASAGTGSPNDCSGGSNYYEWRLEILREPITLGIVVTTVWHPDDPNYFGSGTNYRVCYSTSPAGYGGSDIAGGTIEDRYAGWWETNERGDASWTECRPQDNQSTVAVSCYVGHSRGGTTTACVDSTCGNATATLSTVGACVVGCASASSTSQTSGPDLNPNPSEETVSFAIPITVCYAGCTSASPSLGRTGVVAGSGGPAGGPGGTSTGSGFALYSLDYCIDGACTPLTPSVYAGGGTDASAGPMWPLGCSSGNPMLIVYPYCAPTHAFAHVGGTIAAVQVGSTMVPVNSPVGPVDQCFFAYEFVYETAVNSPTSSPCDGTRNAVSVTNGLPAEGSLVAASATGDAHGGLVAVSGTGYAYSDGGLATVSGGPGGGGGMVTNICPNGTCS